MLQDYEVYALLEEWRTCSTCDIVADDRFCSTLSAIFSNFNFCVDMTSASGEGVNNNAYTKTPSDEKGPQEGTPEYMVYQELQDVIERSKSQKNNNLVTAEIW